MNTMCKSLFLKSSNLCKEVSFCIIWLPCMFSSLDTKFLKTLHRFMTYLLDVEQVSNFFMCPFAIYFKWTW